MHNVFTFLLQALLVWGSIYGDNSQVVGFKKHTQKNANLYENIQPLIQVYY